MFRWVFTWKLLLLLRCQFSKQLQGGPWWPLLVGGEMLFSVFYSVAMQLLGCYKWLLWHLGGSEYIAVLFPVANHYSKHILFKQPLTFFHWRHPSSPPTPRLFLNTSFHPKKVCEELRKCFLYTIFRFWLVGECIYETVLIYYSYLIEQQIKLAFSNNTECIRMPAQQFMKFTLASSVNYVTIYNSSVLTVLTWVSLLSPSVDV